MGADGSLLIHVSELSAALAESSGGMVRTDLATLGPILLAAGLACAAPAMAGSHDQDAVRQAVMRGEIRSLTDILASLRGRLPGEVIGIEIEQKKGRWFYEFRVLDPAGRLFDVYVDGQTAEIERVKEK
jgi:uncharacterized membrane protein YkoI